MFFNKQKEQNRHVIITTENQLTYAEFQEKVDNFSFQSTSKELILLLCENNLTTVTAYIAALQHKHAVMLLGAVIHSELLNHIITTYQPRWIVTSNVDLQIENYRRQGQVLEREEICTIRIHSELAVLLSTSGTTGSQKFVRLSYRNLQSNAEAIAQYLDINFNERGILNLPLSYSYGLSILNSHLQAGAAVLLTDESVVSRSFWSFVKEQRATSLPGVPYTYQVLQKVGFFKMDLPHLRTLTQAGGRLDERLVRLYGEYASEHGKRFFVMYGQTEASPRISYVPSDKLLEKLGTIGIAIPGGKLELEPETNELIYYGDNVMLGYAETLADLAKGDECRGVLRSGDVAIVDEEGYFTVIGRTKRFIKLFGLRISLDDVERRLESEFHQPVACVGNDDKMVIAVESEEQKERIKQFISDLYKLHQSSFKVVVQAIPRMENGKINYKLLKDEQL